MQLHRRVGNLLRCPRSAWKTKAPKHVFLQRRALAPGAPLAKPCFQTAESLRCEERRFRRRFRTEPVAGLSHDDDGDGERERCDDGDDDGGARPRVRHHPR